MEKEITPVEYTTTDVELFKPINTRLCLEYGYPEGNGGFHYSDKQSEPWAHILVLRDQVQREWGREMLYDHLALQEAMNRYDAQQVSKTIEAGAEEYEALAKGLEVFKHLQAAKG